MKPILLFFVALLLALCAATLVFFLEHGKKEGGPRETNTLAPATSTVTATAIAKAGSIPFKVPAGVSPAFSSFLESEAHSLDAPGVDPEAAQARSAAIAEKMGPAEIKFAQEVALDTENAANRRILSVYLLMQAGAKSREALLEIVHKPMPDPGRAEPHSVDEVKSAQGKALQIMAIDALAEQAEKDPAARADLERSLSSLKDETLRKYIRQKLAKLPSL